MKKSILSLTSLILTLFISQSLWGFSRPEDHVVIKGIVIKDILKSPVNNIRIFAVKNGKISPIPFQVDKVDIDGNYIFDDKEAKEKAAARKGKYEDAVSDGDLPADKIAELKRQAAWTENMGMFDSEDEVVFMAWDLGKKADKGMLPKAKIIQEIAITNPVDNDTAYAYVAVFESNPPEISKQSYIYWDPKNSNLQTDYFNITFDKVNAFKFKDCRLKNADGSWGPNFIDQMKMRFKIDIKYFLTLNFDEGNSNGKLMAYKAGPVRVINRLKFWIEIMYIKVTPYVMMDFVYYTNGFVTPAQINIPFSPQSTMNDGSRFTIGQDFNNNFAGAKMYTEKTDVPAILDGVMSDTEKKMDLSNQNWYVVYKEGDIGFFTQMVLDKRLSYVKSEIFYLDDKTVNMKPEDEPGQHMAAFSAGLKQFPKGNYNLFLYTYMGKNWTKGKEKRYLDFINHPLQAKAVMIN